MIRNNTASCLEWPYHKTDHTHPVRAETKISLSSLGIACNQNIAYKSTTGNVDWHTQAGIDMRYPPWKRKIGDGNWMALIRKCQHLINKQQEGSGSTLATSPQPPNVVSPYEMDANGCQGKCHTLSCSQKYRAFRATERKMCPDETNEPNLI